MANLQRPENPQWVPDIFRVETTTPWVGGEEGTANIQAKQFAERTAFLKQFADEVEAARGAEPTLLEKIEKRGVDAQNILSLFSYMEAIPKAASTGNVDVSEGGLLAVDGVQTEAGDLVFLKDQEDRKENGFWEAQTGAWNRFEGFTGDEADKDCFTYKLITVGGGTENRGKIFFLDDDSYEIGTDNLVFKEAAFSSEPAPGKAVIRNRRGRLGDIIYTDALVDESKARNLLDVLGVRPQNLADPATPEELAAVKAALKERINAEGNPEFRGLGYADYLDLPALGGNINIPWNGTYKNLRIHIAGFNTYKSAGDTENAKNHIVFQFRNCPLTRRMNAANDNAGGYAASELASFLEGDFKAALTALFGEDFILPVRRLLSTKGAWAWRTDSVFLPTEQEVFGDVVWGEVGHGGGFQAQLPIYRESAVYKVKRYNGSRQWWWEATPAAASAANFCYVNNNGNANNNSASAAGGVAPAFCAA